MILDSVRKPKLFIKHISINEITNELNDTWKENDQMKSMSTSKAFSSLMYHDVPF